MVLKEKIKKRKKHWESINSNTDPDTNKYRLEQQRIRELDYVLNLIKEVDMFHTEQGLHFGRTAQGDVRIIKYKQSSPKNEVEFKVVLDAESWASTILSVSAKSEDGDTFQEALDFHNDN